MSLKTPGLIKADDFQVTDTVAEGFVKNDAAGNLLFGQAASAWELLEVKEVASATNSITFTGLDGSTERQYMLIYRCQSEGAATGAEYIEALLNGLPWSTWSFTPGLSGPLSTHTRWWFSQRSIHGPGAWELFRTMNGNFSWDIFGRMIFDFDTQNGNAPGGAGYQHAHWTGFNVLKTSWRLDGSFESGGVRSIQGLGDSALPNLTSLELKANTANGISAGSSWHLYKIDTT